MKEEEDFDFIQKFHYTNSFWENTDVLYQHSKQKMDEYYNYGNFAIKISSIINDFAEKLLEQTNFFKIQEGEYISSRNQSFQKILDFITKISQNLKKFASNINNLSQMIDNKIDAYQSRKEYEQLCKDNYIKYKESLQKLNEKKNIYYEHVNSLIENFLNSKYKNSKSKINFEQKLEILNKAKQEYKEEVKKCEEARTEFISVQKNILENEEEFDNDCTNVLKSYFNKFIGLYNEFLNNNKIDQDLINSIEKMDGNKDIEYFSEKNRDIMSSPPRINFSEYIFDMDLYINFQVIKNKMKNINKEDKKELEKEITMDVSKFLEQNINKIDENNEIIVKYSQIVDDILNKKLKQEDYEFIINEFQTKYTDFMKWKNKTINDRDCLKVGKKWDDRFEPMHNFMNIFNKLRMFNKKLEKENYDYYVKIMKKILELNDGDDIDYNLCELVIILSETFYVSEEKDGKEEKKYVSTDIKNCSLFQKFEFWVGLFKNQVNEEIIKERLKKNRKDQKKFFKKKKSEIKIDNMDIYNKIIMAKLISISFNLVHFASNSDILNKALYNIFRFYKLSLNNKQTIIEMIKIQIMNDGSKNFKIDEDLLINDNFDNYKKEKNKIKNKEDVNEIKEIRIINDYINDSKDIENEEKTKNNDIMSDVSNEKINNDIIKEKAIIKDVIKDKDEKENEINGNKIKDCNIRLNNKKDEKNEYAS